MPKVTSVEKHRNICRIDSGNTHGWYARVNWKKKQHARMFSDLKSGGRASALLCAITWRDQLKADMDIPNTHLHIIGGTSSNSGVRGVYWVEKKGRFDVCWRDANGHAGHTSVSANKHGKKKAFKIACEIRSAKEEARLVGIVFPEEKKNSCKKDSVKYSREDLVRLLQEAAKRLERKPTSRDFKGVQPAYHRFESKFGSWNKAIEAAGL